jgi:F-type H+-transporting ATPase subunit delta
MSALSLRYAHAFADVAATHQLDSLAIQQQLGDFSSTFAESSALREVLSNPAIPSDQKLRVLDAIAARLGMYPQVRNFLAVIMHQQRMEILYDILADYHQISVEKSGLAEAEIITARPLDEQSRAELLAQVEKLAGGKVRASYREDAALLGGAVVKIGSTVYDGSIRAQLLGLRQKLVNA